MPEKIVKLGQSGGGFDPRPSGVGNYRPIVLKVNARNRLVGPTAEQQIAKVLAEEAFDSYRAEEVDQKLAEQAEHLQASASEKDASIEANLKSDISRLRADITSTIGKLPTLDQGLVREELVSAVIAELQSVILKMVQETVKTEFEKREQ